MADSADITGLLVRARNGDRLAENHLYDLVYACLRQRAHQLLHGTTYASGLSSGTIVHEAFKKLFRSGANTSLDSRPEVTGAHPMPIWEDRVHFYAMASKAMRQIIVDWARRGQTSKRGSGRVSIPIGEIDVPSGFDSLGIEQVIALSDACDRLTESNKKLAEAIELRFFGGLTIEEMADVLGISDTMVNKRLHLARAFLHRELTKVEFTSGGATCG
jgi:RNA polymerase sigma-70 factor, ECF subfamily